MTERISLTEISKKATKKPLSKEYYETLKKDIKEENEMFAEAARRTAPTQETLQKRFTL